MLFNTLHYSHEFYRGYIEESRLPHDASVGNTGTNYRTFISNQFKADRTVSEKDAKAIQDSLPAPKMELGELMKVLSELSRSHVLPSDKKNLTALIKLLNSTKGKLTYEDYGKMLSETGVTRKGQSGGKVTVKDGNILVGEKTLISKEAFQAHYGRDQVRGKEATLDLSSSADIDQEKENMTSTSQAWDRDGNLTMDEYLKYQAEFNTWTGSFKSEGNTKPEKGSSEYSFGNSIEISYIDPNLKTESGKKPFACCEHDGKQVYLVREKNDTYEVYELKDAKLVKTKEPALGARVTDDGEVWIAESKIVNEANTHSERIRRDYVTSSGASFVSKELLASNPKEAVKILAAMDPKRAAELIKHILNNGTPEEINKLAGILSQAQPPETEALGKVLSQVSNIDLFNGDNITNTLSLLNKVSQNNSEAAANIFMSMDKAAAAEILEEKGGTEFMAAIAKNITEENGPQIGKILEQQTHEDTFSQNSTVNAKKNILAIANTGPAGEKVALKALLAMDPEQAAQMLKNATPEEMKQFAALFKNTDDASLQKLADIVSVLSGFMSNNDDNLKALFGAMDKALAAKIISRMDHDEAVYVAKLLGDDFTNIVVTVDVDQKMRVEQQGMADIMTELADDDIISAKGSDQARAALLKLAGTNPEAALKILISMDPHEAAELLQGANEKDMKVFNALLAKAQDNPAYINKLGRIFSEFSSFDTVPLTTADRLKVLNFLKGMDKTLAAQVLVAMGPDEGMRMMDLISGLENKSEYNGIMNALCKLNDPQAIALMDTMIQSDAYGMNETGAMIKNAMTSGTDTVDNDTIAMLAKLKPENAARVLAELLKTVKPGQIPAILNGLAAQGRDGAKVLECMLLSDWFTPNDETKNFFASLKEAAKDPGTDTNKALFRSCAKLLANMDRKAAGSFISQFMEKDKKDANYDPATTFAQIVNNASPEDMKGLAKMALEMIDSDLLSPGTATEKMIRIVKAMCADKSHEQATLFVAEIAKLDMRTAAELFQAGKNAIPPEMAAAILIPMKDDLGQGIITTLVGFDNLGGTADTVQARLILTKMENEAKNFYASIKDPDARIKITGDGNEKTKDKTMIALREVLLGTKA